MTRPQFFSWRESILKSDLPPTTRHVLLTLACHMNDAGEGCYPSIDLLCKETGLSNRAVITHLQKSAELGWIEVSKHGFAGQRWANNEYRLSWNHLNKKVVNEVHDLIGKVVNVVPKGSEPNDRKVVNEVHTSTSMSTPMSTSYKPEIVSSKSGSIPCPFEDIKNLYHECMPLNPRVAKLNSGRRKVIQARWDECAKGIGGLFGYRSTEDGLKAWKYFFEVCADSLFLTGQVKPKDGSKPFLADIDFLFRESSFTHIIENKYHRAAA